MSQAGIKRTPVAQSQAEVNAYLLFKGECEAAFKFYEKTLGGKVEATMTYGDSPMGQHMPAEWRNKIIHARMTVGSTVLMGSDPPPDRYEAPKGFSVSIGLKDPAEAERIFNALSEGGNVKMPIQQTFWAAKFGMVVDRFGIPWMINCEQPAA